MLIHNNLDLLFLDLARNLTHTPFRGENRFPPTNIVKLSEDKYEIVLAMAGYKSEELDITEHEGNLTVSYTTQSVRDADDVTQPNYPVYIQQGISKRDFSRSWKLDDHIKVTGAKMEDGLLTISLTREVPEDKKPRTINIG
jgi:molecular chaperone IbpA